jgi:hypothetical protein
MLPKIDKLQYKNNEISDPKEIADAFNEFFSEAGVSIANSVSATSVAPEFFTGNAPAPEFHLGRTSPAEILNIIQAFECKNSSDIDGISSTVSY